MKTPPYSLHEAHEICGEFQYLKGRIFDACINEKAIIEQLVITPFDEINKNKFLLYFYLLNDAESILEEVYTGQEFDILVIAHSPNDEKEILHRDLCTWLKNNNPVNERAIIAEALRFSIKNIGKESFNLN